MSKTGDSGLSIFPGSCTFLPKDHNAFHFYGKVDSVICTLSLLMNKTNSNKFNKIQNQLYRINSIVHDKSMDFSMDNIKELESSIECLSMQLPVLKSFIRPGGCEEACLMHMARTQIREAERYLISLQKEMPINENILSYINRLSLYFFVVARYFNYAKGIKDEYYERI